MQTCRWGKHRWGFLHPSRCRCPRGRSGHSCDSWSCCRCPPESPHRMACHLRTHRTTHNTYSSACSLYPELCDPSMCREVSVSSSFVVSKNWTWSRNERTATLELLPRPSLSMYRSMLRSVAFNLDDFYGNLQHEDPKQSSLKCEEIKKTVCHLIIWIIREHELSLHKHYDLRFTNKCLITWLLN